MKKLISQSMFINKCLFYYGYYFFKIFGITPYYSHRAMINLYCLTNGKFINFFNDKFKNKLKYPVKISSDFFDKISNLEYEKINSELNDQGYVKLKYLLKKKIVDKLLSASQSLNAIVDGKETKFNVNNIQSNIYRFKYNDLINNEIIQELIMDPVLINLARNYFNQEPIFDFAAMWWSTDYEIKKEDAAQEYHFDFDRPKWLKIFFYLTDVNENNGPHCYISSSHKQDSKPLEILKKGYVRIKDDELKQYYSQDQFKEIKGPPGTILLGDTLCWHKGKPITKGNRLILQLEFTTSLFGLNTPAAIIKKPNKKFIDFCSNNKFYVQNINLDNN